MNTRIFFLIQICISFFQKDDHKESLFLIVGIYTASHPSGRKFFFYSATTVEFLMSSIWSPFQLNSEFSFQSGLNVRNIRKMGKTLTQS